MKKSLLAIISVAAILPFVCGISWARGQHSNSGDYGYGTGSKSESNYVHGYSKKDGTYVEPYHRTTRDATKNNNYSTYPNYNPWNGETGKRHYN